MLKSCRKSCGICKPTVSSPPTKSPACFDYNFYCAYWASIDHCENINEGDEENNEENERSVVDTEDDNSAVSNITLGNDDLMRNELAEELNVEEGSTYEASLRNDISPRKQDDSEQFEKSAE